MSLVLFVTTLFHHCLPYFSLFLDPNALRTEVLLQPWNGWQAYAFPPYALLFAILLKALLVLWGPQCPWFSGASGSVSRRFGGSASGQGSVEPTSGAVTTSRSVKACSSYLVSIQRFFSLRVFSRRLVFLTYCERFFCTLEPAPMMLLPLMPIVFVALRHLLPFLGIGL